MADMPDQLEAFAQTLSRSLGSADADSVLQSMRMPKRVAYWVNTLKDQALPSELNRQARVSGVTGCWWVPAQARSALVESPAAADGRVYPLNPSSLLAVSCLQPAPGQEVLDLAAAPGGKTLIMAAAMGNSGRIAAVEPVKGRFHRMKANLERCGVTNTQFYLADGRSVGRKVPARFDRVLLDAPCSAEARIRLGEPATYAHWKPRKVKESSRKQRGLIRSAFAALKPGGKLLYCTCTFGPEENELVVDYLLRAEPAADVVEVAPPGTASQPGLLRWGKTELDPRVGRSWRIVPDDLWDGFFFCLITRR